MSRFRQITFWIGLLAIIGSFSAFVYEKELIRQNGKDLLLPLRPADPRSLLQGDYMRLAFADSTQPSLAMQQIMDVQGQLVFKRNEKAIGHYVRLHRGEPLGVDELILNYELKGQAIGRPRLIFVSDSFLFGEAGARAFDQARYAIFKVDRLGDALITGLADEQGQAIRPETPPR